MPKVKLSSGTYKTFPYNPVGKKQAQAFAKKIGSKVEVKDIPSKEKKKGTKGK